MEYYYFYFYLCACHDLNLSWCHSAKLDSKGSDWRLCSWCLSTHLLIQCSAVAYTYCIDNDEVVV